MTSQTFFRLDRQLAGRTSRKVGVATTVRALPDGGRALRYHATDVVTVRDGVVTLNSGGWRTSTTKKRINSALPAGWYLYQSAFEWFIRLPCGAVTRFEDGMTLVDRADDAVAAAA